MANIKSNGGIVAARQQNKNEVATQAKQKSIALVMNELLDSEGIRGRINELLGKRAAQFTGSLVSLVNADGNLKLAFQQAPMTIIQAGLRAATYDLPVDPGLGYAYIVPFKNNNKGGIYEAQFIMGYKGMYQLAMRTGVYKKLNVVDVREGELKHYNRLTEDIEIEFIEDEDEREKREIIGYCGFFRLINGMEKFIYMSLKEIRRHEEKNRKGKYMGKGWREDFDAMARKTVIRKLIGKWGIMSIDYQTADASTLRAAEAIAKGEFDDEDVQTIDTAAEQLPAAADEPATENTPDGRRVDPQTGELFADDEFNADEIKNAENENMEA
ncbi:MAG: recombinase RecT [Phascolarctobacterium sp.]|nr:MAG: recombinase RecT [Phascolarctobacterium sp.]